MDAELASNTWNFGTYLTILTMRSKDTLVLLLST